MTGAENQLSVAEAKRRFSELIDRVGRGERFVVSRRGKPALALVAPGEADEHPSTSAQVGIAAFVGALAAHGDVLDEIVKETYEKRRKAKDRPAPHLDC